jgi:hypothetical protein
MWDVKMVAANDVWAIGEKNVGGPFSTVHWNGNTWTEYILPDEDSNVFIAALAVKPNHDVYALGKHVHKWNGTAWVITDSLNQIPYVSVSAATTLPGGEIWAAGRYFDLPGNYYKNLVIRSDSGTGSNPTAIATLDGADMALSAYPNPFQGTVSIAVSTKEATPAEITLLDMTGRTVWKQKTELSKGKQKIRLGSLADLSAGVYLLQLYTNDGYEELKIIKR